MSVDRTACIGHGWVISAEKYETMRATAEAAGQWDNIEEYFRHINSYQENSDVFFGDIFCTVGQGDYVNIASIIQSMILMVDEEKFSDAMCEILDICGETVTPDSFWHEAQVYMLMLLH